MAESQSNTHPASSTATPKPHRSCDACRIRKVKCPNPGSHGPCANCLRRKTECRFGTRKPSRRRNVNEGFISSNTPPARETLPVVDAVQTPVSDPNPSNSISVSRSEATIASSSHFTPEVVEKRVPPPDLYVDHLLRQAQHPETPESGNGVLTRGNGIIGAYNITFFSDTRLDSLTSRLGNRSVHELVGRISNVVRSRLSKRPGSGQAPILNAVGRHRIPELFTDRIAAKRYIELYFDRLHPLLPFLDRAAFESTAFDSNLDAVLANSKPWICLYHAVLALGSQYDGEGSFEPGAGKAWRLFSVALASFPDLLLQNDSLLTLQAMTAMAVYALSCSCLAIEHVIISEASRRAQNLAGASFAGRTAYMYQRSFWVLYAIEKMSSFQIGRSSIFVDEDISCPIPDVPEAKFGEFNYLLAFLRYARLVSRTLTLLFCVGNTNKPTSYHLETTKQLKLELEDWRLSLPNNGFRPDGQSRPENVSGVIERQAALFIHYLYANMSLIINRNMLLHLSRPNDPAFLPQRHDAASSIQKACRSIIELTTLIEVEPYTNIWILATIPLGALFVLFDIVVHHPCQPEAYSNLALLDMAAGHFSRIEYRSNGTLPASLVSEFAHIARSYVNSKQQSRNSIPAAKPQEESSVLTASLGPQQVDHTHNTPIPVEIPEITSCALPGADRDLQSRIDNDSTTIEGPPSPHRFDEIGTFDYTYDTFGGNFPVESSLGTNVLDLFNNFLPDLDPMLYQGVSGGLGFGIPSLDEETM